MPIAGVRQIVSCIGDWRITPATDVPRKPDAAAGGRDLGYGPGHSGPPQCTKGWAALRLSAPNGKGGLDANSMGLTAQNVVR